ncbi:MAG: M48 family metalloprotease [Thermoanaerobaculia bacterium]
MSSKRRESSFLSVTVSVVVLLAAWPSISEAQSSAVKKGNYVDAMILSTKQVLVNREVSARVASLGRRLVSANPGLSDDFEFEFTVLNDEQLTAFSGQGGRVYLASGLLFRLDSVDELAAAMAHEVAHVQLEHARKQVEMGEGASRWWSVGLDWGLQIASLYVGYKVGGLASNPSDQQQLSDLTSTVFDQTLRLKTYQLGAHVVSSFYGGYEDEFEFEADKLGIEYLERAGFDRTAMSRLFETLLEIDSEPSESPSFTVGLHSTVDILKQRLERIGVPHP